jgi:HSP20 family protein
MSLIKRNGNYSSLRSMMNELMNVDRFLEKAPFLSDPLQVPAVNIKETDQAFELAVAAPGLEKKDFKVAVENNLLTISAEHQEEKEEKDNSYTRKEFSYNSFMRSFELPSYVNAEAIDAQYKEGILTLTLPKKEEAKSNRRKEISVG